MIASMMRTSEFSDVHNERLAVRSRWFLVVAFTEDMIINTMMVGGRKMS